MKCRSVCIIECKKCVGCKNVQIFGVHEVQECVYEQLRGAKGVLKVSAV